MALTQQGSNEAPGEVSVSHVERERQTGKAGTGKAEVSSTGWPQAIIPVVEQIQLLYIQLTDNEAHQDNGMFARVANGSRTYSKLQSVANSVFFFRGGGAGGG